MDQFKFLHNNIMTTIANYINMCNPEYKLVDKMSKITIEFLNMIVVGNYISKNNTLPQDFDISSFPINIDTFYSLLYNIKFLYKHDIKIYNNIDEIIKYLDSIKYIIKPACDAFTEKRDKIIASR